jgi:hypothetical protein
MSNTESVDHLGLGTRFDEVRKTLLQDQFADRLSKPLEYWVLPSDRRLPLVLLGRTLGELLSTPFEELSATPGIGEKKISSLVKLLNRATRDEPPTAAVGDDADRAPEAKLDKGTFDPSVVSEALWSEWRETVRRSGISDQKLGRLAPSLQRLPTVIWHKPLGDYLNHTVAEIRSLRTHGEKRVRCVLEVFHSVYNRLSAADASVDLDRWLMPLAVRDVQDWVVGQLSSDHVPTEEEVNERFARPLIGLIDTDCGATVARLVEERLGINTESRSVREQARQLGVTRARVYQLLDDVGKVMTVRWPEGKLLLDRLTSHYTPLDQKQGQLRLFFGLCELCFPEKQMSSVESTTSPSSAPMGGGDDQPSVPRLPAGVEFGVSTQVTDNGEDELRLASSRPSSILRHPVRH